MILCTYYTHGTRFSKNAKQRNEKKSYSFLKASVFVHREVHIFPASKSLCVCVCVCFQLQGQRGPGKGTHFCSKCIIVPFQFYADRRQQVSHVRRAGRGGKTIFFPVRISFSIFLNDLKKNQIKLSGNGSLVIEIVFFFKRIIIFVLKEKYKWPNIDTS